MGKIDNKTVTNGPTTTIKHNALITIANIDESECSMSS